jgi:hypothetical protein
MSPCELAHLTNNPQAQPELTQTKPSIKNLKPTEQNSQTLTFINYNAIQRNTFILDALLRQPKQDRNSIKTRKSYLKKAMHTQIKQLHRHFTDRINKTVTLNDVDQIIIDLAHAGRHNTRKTKRN